MNNELLNILNSTVANATPLVIAAIGETLNERAGVVNLSLDGSLTLAALETEAAISRQSTGKLVLSLRPSS